MLLILVAKAKFLLFGAAPLAPTIRSYFLSLNMALVNCYGMSESSGAHTLSDFQNFDAFDLNFMKSAGKGFSGVDTMLHNMDKDGNGEICFKGRHVFMGYLKNEEATRETIDENRYLHSGDVGKFDKNGNLTITGRIKELLITAGGENVAPVLIEDEIKKELGFVSNVMVVGDQKKYLSAIITLKHDLDKEGKLKDELAPEVIKELGVKTVKEAKKDADFMKKVQEGINRANSRLVEQRH